MGCRGRQLWLAVAVAAGMAASAASARTRAPRAPRAAPPVVAGPVVAPNRCRALTEQQTSVAALLANGDVALSSGQVARLVDVRIVEEAIAGRSPGTELVGLVATLLVYGGADRWGRVPAALRVSSDAVATETPAVDLATRLVSAGLAFVDAGERDGLCDPGLLAVEAEARARSAGAWAAAPPLAADDGTALAGRAGRFAVVEGRIVSVGERRERTYLNFGRDWSRDFSVVIAKRLWAALKSRGVDAERLRGRRVRVRGIVEAGERAPQVELSAADMLELDVVEARQR